MFLLLYNITRFSKHIFVHSLLCLLLLYCSVYAQTCLLHLEGHPSKLVRLFRIPLTTFDIFFENRYKLLFFDSSYLQPRVPRSCDAGG